MEGKGVYYYEDGTAYYDGTWQNNLKHGSGLYFS